MDTERSIRAVRDFLAGERGWFAIQLRHQRGFRQWTAICRSKLPSARACVLPPLKQDAWLHLPVLVARFALRFGTKILENGSKGRLRPKENEGRSSRCAYWTVG